MDITGQEKIRKRVLPELSEKDAVNGIVSMPMYDESPWCDTPLDRVSVRRRNYRKEAQDGV